MTQNASSEDGGEATGIGRYVPLLVYVIVILTLLCIPLKIISYGYLPRDDALRHAAKAVSGKPWSEILVLAPWYKVDHNVGWHGFLRQIYLWTHCSTETLVVISVVGLFTLLAWSAIPWLKRPEAWLATLIIFDITTQLLGRYTLGRPFLISIAVLVTLLFAWKIRGPSPPGWGFGVLLTLLITVAIYVHGVWYLWLMPIAAFVLARQFRWAFVLSASWVVGTILGASLTGHPIEYIVEAIEMAFKALGMHLSQRTLAGEFQPFLGDFPAVMVFGGLLVLRRLAGLQTRPLNRDPVFWLACMCWVLGFKAIRFWSDWGWPALLVLIACDLQSFIEAHFSIQSVKRLALTAGLAVTAFLATTNDVSSRWTESLNYTYLTKDNPEVAGWLPDKGGILYSSQMSVFYRTFFKNPHGDWRYILGYEPVIMPPEDFKTYDRILWNFYDYKAYQPWVDKMRPQDRLVIFGSKGDRPAIPELEWKYPVSGIWVGRLPRTNSVPTNAAPNPAAPANGTPR